MTSARDEILAKLERARAPATREPAAMTPPAMPLDPIASLRDRLAEAGGSLQIATRKNWPTEIAWPVDLASLEHVYSSLPAVPNRGVGSSARSDHDLDRLEVCVLSAEFAVVENGAVWQRPTTPRERAAALLASHLLVVVDEREIVPTLHQAYTRIAPDSTSFGWFLCGPSKTADIEQSLVLGAHGPCTMSLILLRD
jgi:L-lactate dehydrogenase complex protein LldG